MSRDQKAFRELWRSVLIAALAGLIGGIGAGYVSFRLFVQPDLARLQETVRGFANASGTQPVPPKPIPVEQPTVVIPLESRPLTPAYPAAFADRRQSSVLRLVKRSVRGSEDPVAPEREIGSAVAITSDGWLAAADTALTGLRLNDLSVAIGGRVLPVERGVRDRSTGIVYLKISANGLPTPAFMRAGDLVAGAPVWMEAMPNQLMPEIVLSSRARLSADPVSSERAGRRFLISLSKGGSRLISAAVWDGGGRLIGLVEEVDAQGQARVIPAASLGSSLSQLLSSGEIRRASLGVRALNLGGVTLDIATSSLPELGAWLRPDRKAGLPAVTLKGPSARLLQDGDVIERIERDILDGGADLGERLLDYRPGVTVNVMGSRRGSGFQVQVPLGSESVSENIK